MEKLKAIVVMFIIVAAIVPVYSLNKFLQKVVRPRESIGRLLLYLLAVLVFIFVITYVLVLTIRFLFLPTSK